MGGRSRPSSQIAFPRCRRPGGHVERASGASTVVPDGLRVWIARIIIPVVVGLAWEFAVSWGYLDPCSRCAAAHRPASRRMDQKLAQTVLPDQVFRVLAQENAVQDFGFGLEHSLLGQRRAAWCDDDLLRADAEADRLPRPYRPRRACTYAISAFSAPHMPRQSSPLSR